MRVYLDCEMSGDVIATRALVGWIEEWRAWL